MLRFIAECVAHVPCASGEQEGKLVTFDNPAAEDRRSYDTEHCAEQEAVVTKCGTN